MTLQANWLKVYSSDKAYQIEIAKAVLEEADILSFQVDKKDSSYAFGEIELYVSAEEEINAKLILIEHDLL